MKMMRNISLLPGAVTAAVQCEAVEVDGVLYRDVTLAYIHRYTEQGLLEALAHAGFAVLSTHLAGRRDPSLVCVARAPPKPARQRPTGARRPRSPSA